MNQLEQILAPSLPRKLLAIPLCKVVSSFVNAKVELSKNYPD